jgi:phosphotriesterase-related protein
MTPPFIRTVLGDITPKELGVCYAHEHIIIDDSVATLRYPDFHLPSVDKAAAELKLFHADGGRAMVDSMPCDAGRNVGKLAKISRDSGVHIICPTGLHLAKYYDSGHWGRRYAVEQLAELFIADIEEGIDAQDYSGPLVSRTEHRAGVVKIATGNHPLDDHEQRLFAAAALAHRRTGVPILTHTEQGFGALEQVAFLEEHGVRLNHVVLSHTDRRPDLAYHREILQTGVCVEYDSCFRWPGPDNPTLDLLSTLITDYPEQIMLGMDAARPAYWRSYGGSPGLCFLLNEFSVKMRERGITEEQWRKVFVATPASAYCFSSPQVLTEAEC